MNEPVSTIRNIGPKSEAAFARAGITSAEQLREIGAERAYLKLIRAGTRPHFIGFYALYLGLQGRPWNDLQGEEKAQLRALFDSIVAASKAAEGVSPDLERALDRLGVVPGD